MNQATNQNGQRKDPNDPEGKKKGHAAASVSVPSVFEKYHKMVLSLDPKAKLNLDIQPDGGVKLKMNGVLFAITADNNYSLDQRIVLAFKKVYTEYATSKETTGERSN